MRILSGFNAFLSEQICWDAYGITTISLLVINQLDTSVSEILMIGRHEKLLNDSPQTLSPEVLWGRVDLIDFPESHTESEDSATKRPAKMSIGLTMDPLRTRSSTGLP